MSDVIDNDTEEETSGFGLGRGLDALFGDDEVMGLDDDEPTTEEEVSTTMEELPAEEEGLDMAALMAQEEENAYVAETPEIAEEPQEFTAASKNEDDALIEEIEEIIETMEEEDSAATAVESAPEEEMDMAALMAQEEEAKPAITQTDENIDMAAAMTEMAEEKPQEQEPAPERKTLSDAADSLVSALERHIEENPESAEPKTKRSRHALPIENLYPSPFQPRKIFHQDSIDELASSIRQYGVLQPLLVRKDPKNDDGYEIIAGERRWRASQQAQIHELPVVILDIDELEAYKIALIENLQREDIDPIDEAFGYQKLLEDFDQTQEQLAEAVGKSRPHITNTLRLLQLSEVTQAMVSEKQLSMGHARALIGVENADEIAKKVVKQGLSVRQTEKLAAGAKGKTQTKRPRAGSPAANTSKPEKDADTIALENDISNALGMNVSIDSADGKSGNLSVEFKSLDQLDELLHRLAHFPGTRLSG